MSATTTGIHQALTEVVNGGCANAWEAAALVLRPRSVFGRSARRFAARHRLDAGRTAHGSETLTMRPYRGAVREAADLRRYLVKHLQGEIAGAYVHGSVGTDEVIPYSDFDALVIVKDEVARDARRLARTAYHLNDARRFMLRFDPLQHHGWFAMLESQLGDYPDWFLPVAALREARALLPDVEHTLRVAPCPSQAHSRAQLDRIVTLLERRLREGRYPENAYALKVLLSNVMLLPALYLQARDGTGVFKRDSFDLARRDLPAEIWTVMDDVSEIRARWRAPVSGLRRVLLTRVSPMRRAGKWLAPPVPADLRARLTPAFYARVLGLITAFRSDLGPAPQPVTAGRHAL